MAPPRRPHQSRGAAATSRILSFDDDELDEDRSTNGNTTRVQSEVIDENSNSNDNNVSAPEDNENIPMDTNNEKKLRSNVWKYAKKISKEQAQCIKCKLYIKTPAGGTTTLRKHLITKHNLTHLILDANPRIKTDSSISREQKNRLDNLAYLAIFEDGRTFGDLRKNGITKFLAEAIPDNLNDDDDEQNRDEIMDTWGNDVVTGDVENMDIDENDENDDEENTLLTIEKLAKTIQKSRSLIKLIRRSQILMMYVNDEKKLSGINRRLIVDCISRWNSTYLALQSLLTHKKVLLILYQNKRKLVLTSKQKEKLSLCELSSNEYDILSNLMDIFDSFYQATNLLSGSKYPTIGLCLYVLRQIKDYLEDEDRDEDGNEQPPILISLKRFVLESFNFYFDENDEQYNLLMLYGYFDPFGYSVLTNKERSKIERQIKQKQKEQNKFLTPTTTLSSSTTSSISVPSTSSATETRHTVKQNNEKLSRLEMFLKSINKSISSEKCSTKTISEEISYYGSLFKKSTPMDAVTFWKSYGEQMPMLKAMAQQYLSTPGTSVASESAFSCSSYIGRKERARLSSENLSYTVFLKDKLRNA